MNPLDEFASKQRFIRNLTGLSVEDTPGIPGYVSINADAFIRWLIKVSHELPRGVPQAEEAG